MKIIKVIVDELPVNCSGCQFWEHGRHTGFEVICGLLHREIDVDNLPTRPEWCPLVSTDDLPVDLGGFGWILDDPDSGWEEW
jgi:hypothetical protein